MTQRDEGEGMRTLEWRIELLAKCLALGDLPWGQLDEEAKGAWRDMAATYAEVLVPELVGDEPTGWIAPWRLDWDVEQLANKKPNGVTAETVQSLAAFVLVETWDSLRDAHLNTKELP